MAIGSISFKGTMIASGNQDQLLEISQNIQENAGTLNSKYTNGKSEPNYRYESLPLDGGVRVPSKTVLYATEQDVSKIDTFTKKFYAEGGGKFVGEFEQFAANNLETHFGNPVRYQAIDVLKAISNGIFDFKKLLIK